MLAEVAACMANDPRGRREAISREAVARATPTLDCLAHHGDTWPTLWGSAARGTAQEDSDVDAWMADTEANRRAASACGFTPKAEPPCGLFTQYAHRDVDVDLTLRSECEQRSKYAAKWDTTNAPLDPEIKDLLFCVNSVVRGDEGRAAKVFDHPELLSSPESGKDIYIKRRR